MTNTTYSSNILLTFTLYLLYIITLLILSSYTTYNTYITIQLMLYYAKLLSYFSTTTNGKSIEITYNTADQAYALT